MPFDVTHTHAADPVYAQRVSCLFDRHPATLAEVIDQFEVATNPRYRIRDTSGDGKADTFCNVFATDVAQAMGVQLPHWWRGRELSANALHEWLQTTGLHFGWLRATAREALEAANAGKLAVATWCNPAGSGHIAVARPSEGPLLFAQAGRHNMARADLTACFGRHAGEVLFFVHP